MGYMHKIFYNPFSVQSNFDPCQDIPSNMDLDWLNFTVSDDEELGQFDNSCLDTLNSRETEEQSQLPSFTRTTQIQQLQISKDNTTNEKKITRSYPDSAIIKRRRGPNKNQKVLTEEERKKKKAKALCRNAESARTCRGKRKQAEEKLKIKSSNMERDFHILCQTRRELSHELFDLLEQARSIKDPRILEAVDQSAIRLSSLMTQGQMTRDMISILSPSLLLPSLQGPLESLPMSGQDSASSIPQQISTNLPMIVPEYSLSSSTNITTPRQGSKIINQKYSDELNWSQQSENTRNRDISTGNIDSDFPLSRQSPRTNSSPCQNGASMISRISTPTSMAEISLIPENDVMVLEKPQQEHFTSSPNPFMGDETSQEEFEKTQLIGILPSPGSPFHGQISMEQKPFGYMFPPSPMAHYDNDSSSTVYDEQVYMRSNPVSLDVSNFAQETLEFSLSQQRHMNQPHSTISIDEHGPSDLDCAIVQLINFT